MPDPYTTVVQLSTGYIVTAQTLSLEELLDGARTSHAPYIGELRARFGVSMERAVESWVHDAAAELVHVQFMSLPWILKDYSGSGRF